MNDITAQKVNNFIHEIQHHLENNGTLPPDTLTINHPLMNKSLEEIGYDSLDFQSLIITSHDHDHFGFEAIPYYKTEHILTIDTPLTVILQNIIYYNEKKT